MTKIVKNILAKRLPSELRGDLDDNDQVEIIIRVIEPIIKRDLEVDREFENGEYTSFSVDDIAGIDNWFKGLQAQ